MKNRINTKLLLINLIGILVATALLTTFSSSMIRSVFQKRYEDKLQTPGRIFLTQYTYRDIAPYIDRLLARESLLAGSRQYLQDRQIVLNMERNDADREFTPAYFAAKERMEAYIDELNELKDEKYHTIKKRMLDLRIGAGLTYFYIFADLGVPGAYIQLFDAVFEGSATSSFGEDYGTPIPKAHCIEAEEAFRTGEPVIVLSNSESEVHDKTYYSFTPIKDLYGNVVAVIGTDINMQSLETQLESFVLNSVSIMVVGTFLLLCAMYFALRRLIIEPILKLTALSSDISAGNIDGEIPAWVHNRTDEMGILGKSFAAMGAALREMLGKNDALFEAAMSGRLDARSDPSSLGGLFAQLANKINDTLDVIGSYFDSISSPLAILNAGYDVVYTNHQYKRTFAGVPDHMVYQRILGAEETERTDDLKQRLATRLEQGDFTALEWFVLPKGRRCLSILCSRVTRDGLVNGAIIVVTDATELVTAKDNALSANKAKSEFLSRVSHELRTPLNVILSMAKLGLADKQLEESTQRFGKIVTSSSHLSNIINDVLEMSRMESGKTEIKREPMRLKTVAEECVELLLMRAEENHLALSATIDPELPNTVMGDEFRIRQILINLLSNALKFTAEGEVSLSVEVTERGDNRCTVRFAVTDTGIGMSEAFQKKIFTPFEQEDSFLSRRYEGSGLGLSISYNLAALMGGTMTVESKPGEGSRFAFAIPFDIPDAAAADEAESVDVSEISLQGKRILLADDIEVNRLIVLEVFAAAGAELEQACDGEEAVQMFLRSPAGYYDCVLMDIQMPKMDGYTATGAIRASGRADSAIPIIAMTANALKEDIDRSMAVGMNDHIAKPIDFDECLRKAKQWTLKGGPV